MSMKEMVKKLEKAAEPDRITITRGDKNKILIDFTGDGGPEAALIDTTGSDVPDLLAIDLTGDHKFNLFLDDTNDNNYPDVVYIDKNGDGNIQLIGTGEQDRGELHHDLVRIFAVLTDRDADEEALNKALRQLAQAVQGVKRHYAENK